MNFFLFNIKLSLVVSSSRMVSYISYFWFSNGQFQLKSTIKKLKTSSMSMSTAIHEVTSVD
jgi:hypothetical protein